MAAVGESGGGSPGEGSGGNPVEEPIGTSGGDPGGASGGDPGQPPEGPGGPPDGGAPNLPFNFDALPNELKFQILDQLDAASLSALGDTSTVYQDLVLSYVDHLVASDQLIYPMSGNSVRGGTFPGEDWIGPFDFDTDPASTLAVWQRNYVRRA